MTPLSMALAQSSPLTGRTPTLLIGVAVAIAGILGTMLLWFVHSERENTIATSEAHVMGMTRAHAAALTRALSDYERELDTLGESIANHGGDSDEVTRHLHRYRKHNAELMDLLVLDEKGVITAWTQEGERPDVTNRDYFTAHRENAFDPGEPYISPPLQSRVHDDRPFMAMSRSLETDDGSRVVLVFLVDIEQLAHSLETDTQAIDTTMVATTLDGTTYFRLPYTEEAAGTVLEPMTTLEHIEREMLEHVTSPFDGEEYIVGLRRLDPYPMAVIAGKNRSQALVGESRKALIMGLLYLFALLLISAVTRLLVRLFRDQEATSRSNRERAKEAVALNTVIHLSLDEEKPVGEFLQASVDAIPPGFQDPDRTAARIRLPDQVVTSTPFFEGPLSLETPLVVGSEPVGSLEVFLSPGEHQALGFLPEEQRLMEALAGHLGQALHRRAVLAERRAMQTDLERSNADLEQFAYAVSHDLREPLRMVNSYLGLLTRQLDEDGTDLPESARERIQHYLDHARDGATRMDKMLLSLLDYSRVGRATESMAEHDARALVDEALAFLGPSLEESDATVEVSGEWPTVHVSRDELTRLFQNLVGNALKYRSPDTAPTIHIHASVEGRWFRACVEDDGIGIAPEQLDRLFKVFSRLHTRDEYQGHGIGLALCRRIAEHHGGTIEAESEGPGHGSRFCFRLPVVVESGRQEDGF
ncbi:MAG: ATP-binding protein [Pseudomonadota bacterium]